MTPTEASRFARPGDVLLFHRPSSLAEFRRDFFGTLMTTIIHLTTRSRFNHASLALGGGKHIEATNVGIVVDDLINSRDDITVVPADYPDAGDREDVLAWATAREGTRYGYLNAAICGIRNMLPGPLQIKMGDSMICSELVADALHRSGDHDLGKDPALVSPGDLADYFGVPRA